MVEGQGDHGVANDAIPSVGISEVRVKELISDSLASFSQSFADSMKDSFAKIDDLISQQISQVNVNQDVDNFSFSESPHVPIQPSLGTERPDPSQVSAQQDYGKSGCDPEESVRGESAISPDLMSWVSDLQAAGFRIRDQVANLIRPARDDARASVLCSQPVDSLPGGSQVDSSSASTSRGSLGIFPPSEAFDSSACPNPAHRVSFDLPPLGDDEFGEGDSVVGEAAPPSEGLSCIS